jgi:excisionase family DNA binding protein
MEQEYLTTNEVVKMLRVSKVTLLKMVHDGKVRAYKIGNGYRFKKDELEEDTQEKVKERVCK